MDKVFFNHDALVELKQIAEYLYDRHPELIKDQRRLGMGRNKDKLPNNPTEKLAYILDYTYKAIYYVLRHGSMKASKFRHFKNLVELLEIRKRKSEQDNHTLSRCRLLIDDIEKNVVSRKSTDTALRQIEKSSWYMYERYVDAIGRKVVRFGGIRENEVSVTVLTTEEGMRPWTGKAFADTSGDYLTVFTSHEVEEFSLPVNYLFRINGKSNDPDLCFGHMTLAKHTTQNVLTKSVVLARQKNTDDLDALEIPIEDAERSVPWEIFRFLYDRPMNRLSSPHQVKQITTLKQLGAWFQENDEQKRGNRNENLVGLYSIFYERDRFASDLRRDRLLVKETLSADLEAVYSHEVDPNKPQTWRGEVKHSPITRAVFFSMEGPVKKRQPENVSSIFLILNLPTGERDFNVLTGVVSGIKDNYDGSIGMMVVACKHSKGVLTVTKSEREQKEMSEVREMRTKVQAFFDANKFQVALLPPTIPVASYEDLEKAVPEALEIGRKIRETFGTGTPARGKTKLTR